MAVSIGSPCFGPCRQNIKAGKIIAGGSTITQQFVKILFLGPERTYDRKVQEAAIAIWLEHHVTKDEILTSYLNNVYLGSGAVGFPAAAKRLFWQEGFRSESAGSRNAGGNDQCAGPGRSASIILVPRAVEPELCLMQWLKTEN